MIPYFITEVSNGIIIRI